jgi:glycosyltransferase involved in cell wall biosynthesis
MRIASIIPGITAGGIGPVCRYAAADLSRHYGWQVTLVCLHDRVDEIIESRSGLRITSLGLGLNQNCARHFLDWLNSNPQDILITSDVGYIEEAFPYIPPETRHVAQIHDSLRRYRDVAVRHSAWLDGVTCVGRHIEQPLRRSLDQAGFKGLLRTVHNGAHFPPLVERSPHPGALRLLFMGRLDPFKGIFDLVLILGHLHTAGVPATLTIVGGTHDALALRFARKGLTEAVTWAGRVPHEECYRLAAEHDIFLMPSRKEPFGMVTIEAMSMGAVPIAYDVPSGSSEIIEHGRSGLLVPLGNYQAWAKTIQELHEDRSRLASLSAGAIERARTVFNADVMSSNLATFLTDVMENASREPCTRLTGLPPEKADAGVSTPSGYQRLPASLRERIRDFVGSKPRLCYWLLNRE